MGWVAMIAAAIAVGWAATGGVRILVLRTGVLDRPNVRSSHIQLTATLGGVGIMAGLWAGIAEGQGLFGIMAFPPWKALLGSTAVLVLLAYDEVRPMGRLAKLAVQVAAGVLLVAYGVVLQRITLPALGGVDLGWMGHPITLVWLVGLQNLYNFMDGIDGIVALEALLVAGLLAGLAAAVNLTAFPVMAALAGACLGFYVWNLPPARIFVGDVGANFIGLAFGALAVVGEEGGFRSGLPCSSWARSYSIPCVRSSASYSGVKTSPWRTGSICINGSSNSGGPTAVWIWHTGR